MQKNYKIYKNNTLFYNFFAYFYKKEKLRSIKFGLVIFINEKDKTLFIFLSMKHTIAN